MGSESEAVFLRVDTEASAVFLVFEVTVSRTTKRRLQNGRISRT